MQGLGKPLPPPLGWRGFARRGSSAAAPSCAAHTARAAARSSWLCCVRRARSWPRQSRAPGPFCTPPPNIEHPPPQAPPRPSGRTPHSPTPTPTSSPPQLIARYYMKFTGMDADAIERNTNRDTFMTPEDAKQARLGAQLGACNRRRISPAAAAGAASRLLAARPARARPLNLRRKAARPRAQIPSQGACAPRTQPARPPPSPPAPRWASLMTSSAATAGATSPRRPRWCAPWRTWALWTSSQAASSRRGAHSETPACAGAGQRAGRVALAAGAAAAAAGQAAGVLQARTLCYTLSGPRGRMPGTMFTCYQMSGVRSDKLPGLTCSHPSSWVVGAARKCIALYRGYSKG